MASRLDQRSEAARNRAFLALQRSDTESALDRTQQSQLKRLLESVPAMARATSASQLRKLLLETLQLVPLEAALWLEKEADWAVLEWFPHSIHPRYSRSLLEACRSSGELCWGQPEQLLASRSILLSEVRSIPSWPSPLAPLPSSSPGRPPSKVG
ncbi:hypothetical protein IV102_25555 [bacterium]|nr:hypothetical protein [bacterium]